MRGALSDVGSATRSATLDGVGEATSSPGATRLLPAWRTARSKA